MGLQHPQGACRIGDDAAAEADEDALATGSTIGGLG
jgi:hypothetical protein